MLENNNFEISTSNNNKWQLYLKNNKYLSIKPDESHDGFFICKMRKKL